jgi:8-oxo-dGTP diphosphatase
MIEERYCCGFVTDECRIRVLLIQKNRPDWQAGKLNGIGGHVEEGETDREAMSREFQEEAGVCVDKHRWNDLAVARIFDPINRSPLQRISFFYFASNQVFQAARTRTDEEVGRYFLKDILIPILHKPVPNLPTLLAHLLRRSRDGDAAGFLELRYTS